MKYLLNMSKIKLIATDLDGTLLRSDKTISAYTASVLEKCQKQGIKLVFATGRGQTAAILTQGIDFDGKITMNGAVGKIGDEVVYSRLIPSEILRPILVNLDKMGINVATQVGGIDYSNFVASDFWPWVTSFKITDFTKHSLDAEKVYCPKTTPEQRAYIEKMLPENLYTVVTADTTGPFLQIMHKEASKSKAIAALADVWGISFDEIVAFGDDLNDVDMLLYAGIGVAMGGALDEVKAVANQICKENDDDGVACWIEENIYEAS